MNTVSLGFECDTTIDKSAIAQIQLVEAIALFLSGKYLCAITLAGSAEAVLAGLLTQQDDRSAVEDSVKLIQRVRDQTGLSMMGGKKNNEIFNGWNEARNKLKHHGKDEEETVTLNLFDESYWMIKRGLSNAEKLAVPIANQDRFENWVILNINM